MTTNDRKRQKLQESTTTILDLPFELIEYICSFKQLKTNDIFNLALSHRKLNDCLFREQNSCLWKLKYIQKYGLLDKDEYEIVIDEQNNWKDEMMMRMNFDRAVPTEIAKMPSKFMKLKNIPYHLYPFGEQLNSKNEAHRYYIIYSSTVYYNRLLSKEGSNENYDLMYMAHQFLFYSCQVYFGYKLQHFLSLLPAEQTIERGFYLIGRWWYPTNSTSYFDIAHHFNDLAITVCNFIQSKNPAHPLFKYDNVLDHVIKLGKTNLDHDLFDEANTIIILDCIRQVVFADNEMVCYCTHDIHCFLLQEVIKRNKGSVFLLCVVYESVARRLGVKVRLTATSVHNFVSWSSSWPGGMHINSTNYFIDIAGGAIMRKATVCPVSKKLPEQFIGNCISDLFWTFSKAVEQLTTENMATYKYLLDFQKLLKPDDTELEFKCEKFHKYYDFCRCPLLRDSMNPDAPNHIDEKNHMYPNWKEIFPLEPKTRGTNNDPNFAIGMIIDNITPMGKVGFSTITKSGVIVGWTRKTSQNPTIYHVIIRFDHDQSPVIYNLNEDIYEKLNRQLIPFYCDFKYIGKFFKHYDYKLCAYVPIDGLAQIYPDDLSYTISKSKNLYGQYKST